MRYLALTIVLIFILSTIAFGETVFIGKIIYHFENGDSLYLYRYCGISNNCIIIREEIWVTANPQEIWNSAYFYVPLKDNIATLAINENTVITLKLLDNMIIDVTITVSPSKSP